VTKGKKMQRIYKTNSWFFAKINKVDKLLANLIEMKSRYPN
jgi:hypothetical protein